MKNNSVEDVNSVMDHCLGESERVYNSMDVSFGIDTADKQHY
ncbi:hypothetical protein SAMN02745166_01175 [Prosthecobacter debontii]|uniref:Uncharacterized protein n=1 Tax=Prosthecobacter debontii TaxID=48467 RepID=A0A1T4X7M7_9BACT|nr:hypothetical protein [Prosthecobacter debontii]SKA85643.1 hypothetical protein SAMN02745166_01175 [Prosthecobacter debontii]